MANKKEVEPNFYVLVQPLLLLNESGQDVENQMIFASSVHPLVQVSSSQTSH